MNPPYDINEHLDNLMNEEKKKKIKEKNNNKNNNWNNISNFDCSYYNCYYY